MNPKIRNWIIGSVVIVVFILGVPLVQIVFAGSEHEAAIHKETAIHEEPAAHPAVSAHSNMSHPQVVKVGEQYLQIATTGNDSICAMLYDSSFKLIAVNESETALKFTLPSGEKKTVNITVPATSGCSAEQGSSSKDSCCAPGATSAVHESCSHGDAAAQ